MEFQDVVRRRRMVRAFTAEPVDPAVVASLLDLARHAPSAGYTQGQSFITVTRPDLKQALANLCGEAEYTASGFAPFISGAPVLIVPCTSELAYHRRYQEADKVNPDGSEIIWPVPYWFMDIGCAAMLLMLAAVDAGLATAFAGAHDLAGVRALLGIPAEVTPMGVIALGHAAPDKPSPSLKRGRKPVNDVVHSEGW
jgi:nitroreductase